MRAAFDDNTPPLVDRMVVGFESYSVVHHGAKQFCALSGSEQYCPTLDGKVNREDFGLSA